MHLLLTSLLTTGFVVPPPSQHGRAAVRMPTIAMNDLMTVEKYGGDPRAKYEKEWGPINPDAKWAASNTKRGAVGLLGSVEQLQAAISAAGDGLVVMKFEREGCVACEETRQDYLDAAAEFSEKGLFYIVDFNKSKPFCRETGIKFVPAGVEHAQEIPHSHPEPFGLTHTLAPLSRLSSRLSRLLWQPTSIAAGNRSRRWG